MAADETMARLRRITVGEVEQRSVVLADPDPGWAARFTSEAVRIRAVLGSDADVHHVGSTAVVDLPAKPTIDMVLVVPDAADESVYVPPLEEIGYELRIREPDWYEHRLLRLPPAEVHLHVFGRGCPEVDRMLRFRDRLRADPAARDEYARVKRQLAGRDWATVEHYAEAKTGVITRLLGGRNVRHGTKRENGPG